MKSLVFNFNVMRKLFTVDGPQNAGGPQNVGFA